MTQADGGENPMKPPPAENKSEPALNLKLTIRESAGTRRDQEPVTSGVPLPRTLGLRSAERLKLVDAAGQTVPAQFGVLSRWGGGPQDPIRWLLVDFQADVPANRQAAYWLRNDGGNPTSSPLRIIDNRVIETGAMRVELGAGLFQKVLLDLNRNGVYEPSEEIVSPNQRDGATIKSHAWPEANIEDGVIHRATVSSITVEEQGPLRISVRIEGTHKGGERGDPTGLYDYVIRLHAYKNKSFVKMVHSLKSARNGVDVSVPKSWPFREMSIATTLNLSGARHFTFGTKGKGVRGVLANEPVTFRQTMLDSFSAYKGEQTLATGTRGAGWGDLSSEKWGLTVAIDHWWQQWPKGFRVNGSTFYNELWPESDETYWIQAHTRKTHYIFYHFHAGNMPTTNLAVLADRPLVALPDIEWVAKSRAWDSHIGVPSSPVPAPGAWDIQTVNSGWQRWGRTPITSGDCYSCGGEQTYQFTLYGPFLQSGGAHYLMFEAGTAAVRMWCDQFDIWMDHPNDVIFTMTNQLTDRYANAYRALFSPFSNDLSVHALVFSGYKTYGVRVPGPSHFRFLGITENYYLTGDRSILDAIKMYAEYVKFMVWRPYNLFGDPLGGRALFHPLYFYALAYGVFPHSSYRDYATWLMDFLWERKLNKDRGFINDWCCDVQEHPNPVVSPYQLGMGQSAFHRVWENMRLGRAHDLLYGVAVWTIHELQRCWNHFGSGYPFQWWPESLSPLPPGYKYKDGCPQIDYGYNQYSQSLMSFAFDVTGRKEFLDVAKEQWRVLSSWGPKMWPRGAGLWWSSSDKGEHHPEQQSLFYAVTLRAREVTNPPEAVTDLRAEPGPRPRTVKLSWTGPARADLYRIKNAEKPIVEWYDWQAESGRKVMFWAAQNVSGEPAPAAPGRQQEFVVTGLPPGQKLYFALKSMDPLQNMSELSNVVSVTVPR
jgi:hypothetical protein